MKTIFCNGVYDVLTVAHLRLLKYAASLGDRLIVAIDSDKRVKELKGNTRPFNNAADRMEFLSSFDFVDEVVEFNDCMELKLLITSYNTHTMVVGSEYKDKYVVGSENAKEVVFFDRIENYSSTAILNHNLNKTK